MNKSLKILIIILVIMNVLFLIGYLSVNNLGTSNQIPINKFKTIGISSHTKGGTLIDENLAISQDIGPYLYSPYFDKGEKIDIDDLGEEYVKINSVFFAEYTKENETNNVLIVKFDSLNDLEEVLENSPMPSPDEMEIIEIDNKKVYKNDDNEYVWTSNTKLIVIHSNNNQPSKEITKVYLDKYLSTI